MYGRVVTTRGSAQRTQARSQQALRPLNCTNPGERVLGDLSREEARRQQTQKYKEDSKKFAEKEKQKAQKKKEERWKRYSHVDVGQRLNSDEQEFETDVEFIRNQQQLMYEFQSVEGLEWERERENSRALLEARRREERLKRHGHVTCGQQLGPSEQTASPDLDRMRNPRQRQQLQFAYELQAAEGPGPEEQEELARRQPNRERKLRKYEHVDVGHRLHADHTNSPSTSRSADMNTLGSQMNDINLNVNYDRAMEQKTKHYQGTNKLKTETASSNYSSGETSASLMNNLNATCEMEDEMAASISQADRDHEHRERMRLARERLQSKYNEELHKSS